MFASVTRIAATLAIVFASGIILTAAAQAQKVRFVASNGDNANNCTRAAPCRSLQRGIDQTPARGELQILDAGFYGPSATIDKSITISAVGVSATIGTLVINAPDATVVLRGLLLNGAEAPRGTVGMAIEAADVVHIVDCEIERFPNHGMFITAFLAEVFVANTTIRSNLLHGLSLSRPNGTTPLTIVNSRFESNGASGISISGPSQQVMVENSVSSRNGSRGLIVAGGGAVRISNSVFTFNNTGLENASSIILSRGNNTVSGNSANTVGSISQLSGI